MVLLLDNFDSFTWNIVHVAARAAPHLRLHVLRADRLTPAALADINPSHIILSPGPRGPADAHASLSLLASLAGKLPILGVCLGHQCIAHHAGLSVRRAPAPVHGKTSLITHDNRTLFAGLPSPMPVMRYHSLAVDPAAIDTNLWDISASTTDHAPPVIMALRRRWSLAPLEGVQFHPESFATPHGAALLANFLAA